MSISRLEYKRQNTLEAYKVGLQKTKEIKTKKAAKIAGKSNKGLCQVNTITV